MKITEIQAWRSLQGSEACNKSVSLIKESRRQIEHGTHQTLNDSKATAAMHARHADRICLPFFMRSFRMTTLLGLLWLTSIEDILVPDILELECNNCCNSELPPVLGPTLGDAQK